MSDHACFDCGHPVSHHSGQVEASGCRDCECQRWFVVTPAGHFDSHSGKGPDLMQQLMDSL